MRSLTPSLWFDANAEEAVVFYLSVFPGGREISRSHYPDGRVLAIEWEMAGTRFMGINGGPQFTFSEAVSFTIPCEDQAEVDRYWSALLADGGQESQCGWLKDRFGLSWQVVPDGMQELLSDPDPARAQRALAAMMTMVKLDLPAMRAAADAQPS